MSRNLTNRIKLKKKMNIERRLAVLDRIYAVYNDFSTRFDWACQKYCADCCTCNVIATTLEGYKIAKHWSATGQADWFDKALKASSPKRFQPLMTFNGLAEGCIQGDHLPEEHNDQALGRCPFLTGDQCPIYAVRPFGCRCMVSKKKCKETGYADMDPLMLTVNHICLQYIEHIDARGFSGNLTDVLIWMTSAENRWAFRQNRPTTVQPGLVSNRPVRFLMVPPEHRSQIRPIFNALNNIHI